MLGDREPPPPRSLLLSSLRFPAVMATPNNLTPTNCSWWPISALESDAAKPVEAPVAPEAASPAHWPKESLVLYHWTQSFSSQKVEPEGAREQNAPSG